jgi:hypothetical protein
MLINMFVVFFGIINKRPAKSLKKSAAAKKRYFYKQVMIKTGLHVTKGIQTTRFGTSNNPLNFP